MYAIVQRLGLAGKRTQYILLEDTGEFINVKSSGELLNMSKQIINFSLHLKKLGAEDVELTFIPINYSTIGEITTEISEKTLKNKMITRLSLQEVIDNIIDTWISKFVCSEDMRKTMEMMGIQTKKGNTREYPSGCYNLMENRIRIASDNNRVFFIKPESTEIFEDRSADALVVIEEVMNGHMVGMQEIPLRGKVQLSKSVGCKFEILAIFKGKRIHMPFRL